MLVCPVALLLCSCGFFHTTTSADVAGEYVYKYKSGEIEVWILHPDFTYQQEFYKTVADYRQGASVAFKNSGTWSLSTNKVTLLNNKIALSEPLDFFDYGNIKRPLEKPLHVDYLPADWYGSSGDEGATIAINQDIDYVLYRDSNRNQVQDNKSNP